MASQYLKSSIKPLTYVGGFVLLSALGGCASLTGQPLASGADAGTVNARAQAPNPGRLSIADLVNLPLDSAAQSDLKKAAPKAGGLWGVIASDYGMPM